MCLLAWICEIWRGFSGIPWALSARHFSPFSSLFRNLAKERSLYGGGVVAGGEGRSSAEGESARPYRGSRVKQEEKKTNRPRQRGTPNLIWSPRQCDKRTDNNNGANKAALALAVPRGGRALRPFLVNRYPPTWTRLETWKAAQALESDFIRLQPL